MKRFVSCMSLLLVLEVAVLIVSSKMLPVDVMEITLSGYHDEDKLKDYMDAAGLYDYLIISGIYSPQGNVYVYEGDIFLMLHGKSGNQLEMDDGREVLLGSKYVEDNYYYNPIGEKYESMYGEYVIGGIMQGDGIYYNDTDMAANSDIRVQRIYVVLRNKEYEVVDRDTTLSILRSSGVRVLTAVYYRDIINFIRKVIILTGLIIMIHFVLKAVAAIKQSWIWLWNGYAVVKYETYVLKFLSDRENRNKAVKLLICVVYMAVCVVGVLYFSVKFLNMRMPFKLNPVSPRSIGEAIGSFGDLMSIYCTYGVTESAKVMAGMALVVGSCMLVLVLYGLSRFFSRER